jgi:hypothetical protein
MVEFRNRLYLLDKLGVGNNVLHGRFNAVFPQQLKNIFPGPLMQVTVQSLTVGA